MNWSEIYPIGLIFVIVIALYTISFFRNNSLRKRSDELYKKRLDKDNKLAENIRNTDWLTNSFSEIEINDKLYFYFENDLEGEVIFLKPFDGKYRIGKLIYWTSPLKTFENLPIEFPDDGLKFGVETGFFYKEIEVDRVIYWEDEYKSLTTFWFNRNSEKRFHESISLKEYLKLLDSKESLIGF